jgi:hypothetical protein
MIGAPPPDVQARRGRTGGGCPCYRTGKRAGAPGSPERPGVRYRWPDGQQCAVVLSFDFDAESGFRFWTWARLLRRAFIQPINCT